MKIYITELTEELLEVIADSGIEKVSDAEYIINRILKDAIHSFVSKREYAEEYVRKGYEDRTLKGMGMTREDKVNEVRTRRDIAKALHDFNTVKFANTKKPPEEESPLDVAIKEGRATTILEGPPVNKYQKGEGSFKIQAGKD